MSNSENISLYIHIPFCISKCTYCDFFSVPVQFTKTTVPQEYVDALCNEISFRLNQYDVYKINTVYIGGGTPSLLSEKQIEQISDVIREKGLTIDYEFTFEVNPDDVTQALLINLDKAGVNRISCGIQSFSEDVLKCVHRRANLQQNYDCFKLFKSFWHKKLSVDVICGLPYETENTLISGLDFLVKQNIPHISFYSLCVEEETPLGKDIITGKQKYNEDFSDELWIKGRDFLLSKGYIQYEVSNFCLSGFECIHNMAYWTHKSYIGCGSGAAGTIYKTKDKQDFRYTNTKNIEEYIKFWSNSYKNHINIPQTEEIISGKTSKYEYFMMALRTLRGVSPAEYEKLFDEKMPQTILEYLNEKCRKSASGFYYLDNEQILFLNSFLLKILEMIN